jgi:hypothetical protein
MLNKKAMARNGVLILAVFLLLCIPAWGGEKSESRDRFFKGLIFGRFGHVGLVGANIAILSVPINKPFAKEVGAEEQLRARNAWMERAAEIWFDQKDQDWKKKVNMDFLIANSGVRVGEKLQIRTPRGQTTAKVTALDIDISDIEGPGSVGPEFIAIAPLDREQGEVAGDLILASRYLPPCPDPCRNTQILPQKGTWDKVSVAGHQACGLTPDPEGDVGILEGHFSEMNKKQFVVRVIARSEPDLPFKKMNPHFSGVVQWGSTVVLDSDLSPIELLNKSLDVELIPDSVGDINNDGLDEIWAVRSILTAGDSAPFNKIYYWRGQDEKQKFGMIYYNNLLMGTSISD